jgi:hypothetical protein
LKKRKKKGRNKIFIYAYVATNVSMLNAVSPAGIPCGTEANTHALASTPGTNTPALRY